MDGEPEVLSDSATQCILTSASDTLSDNNQARLDTLEKKAIHLSDALERLYAIELREAVERWEALLRRKSLELLNALVRRDALERRYAPVRRDGRPWSTMTIMSAVTALVGHDASLLRAFLIFNPPRLALEKDFKAADIKWSLFVAAAFSFRYESCLKPFPPAFLKNGVKDMDELLSVITDVPALDLVLQQLSDLDNLSNLNHIIDLLFYVLVRLKDPVLKTVPTSAHGTILLDTNYNVSTPKPQYIFQVVNSSKSPVETKWRELSRNHNVFYAYHGNRLENFYTILNFGLQQHLNKNTLLGNGIYLAPDLKVSLPYSHGGFGWGASCIGSHLSCIALCEVIDAPAGINYHKPVSNEGDGIYEDEKGKPANQNIEGQMTQYIVTDCDLVRVRYMLVYAKQPASLRFPATSVNRNGGGVRQWICRHKLFSILLGYGLMLATIGFANNQPFHYYYKILLKKLDIAYSSVKV